MSTLSARITDLATRIAKECKSLRTLVNGNAADLSALNTQAKTNLVAAVNELKAAIDAQAGIIADTQTATNKTWSSSKIAATIAADIAAANTALLNGAPAALDTLKELADAIGDDANFAGTVTAALANRVRFDAAQTLTAGQQAQALTNIGGVALSAIGAPDTDFVALFNAGLA